MSVLSPLADPCPSCHPGDYPAVLPFLVTSHGRSLRAWYKHDRCGSSWSCRWDAEPGPWPVSRGLPEVPASSAVFKPVTPEQAARNREILERELDAYELAHPRGRRPRAGAA